LFFLSFFLFSSSFFFCSEAELEDGSVVSLETLEVVSELGVEEDDSTAGAGAGVVGVLVGVGVSSALDVFLFFPSFFGAGTEAGVVEGGVSTGAAEVEVVVLSATVLVLVSGVGSTSFVAGAFLFFPPFGVFAGVVGVEVFDVDSEVEVGVESDVEVEGVETEVEASVFATLETVASSVLVGLAAGVSATSVSVVFLFLPPFGVVVGFFSVLLLVFSTAGVIGTSSATTALAGVSLTSFVFVALAGVFFGVAVLAGVAGES